MDGMQEHRLSSDLICLVEKHDVFIGGIAVLI